MLPREGKRVHRLPQPVSLLVSITFTLASAWVHAASLPSSIDLLNGVSGGTRISGAHAGDQLAGKYYSPYSSTSHPLAGGDLNGDGYDDIIVGAPEAANGGLAGAGAVYVVYGDPSPAGALDLSAAIPGLTILGARSADHLGTAVATGDINGDGIEDLLIGAPGHDNPDDITLGAGHGAVYVIYGSRSLPKAIDLASSSADLTLLGKDNGGRLGQGLASADVNGDGRDDILAGAPAALIAGRVEVIYGGASLPATINLRSTDPDARINGTAGGDWTGAAVAAGDINGDGYADILIGAPHAQAAGGSAGQGAVFVVYGAAALGPLALPDGASVTVYGDAAGDNAGWSVASGDIDADGHDDLIIGAPGVNGGQGAAYLLYGSAALSGTLTLAGGAGALIPGSSAADALGYAVAAADLNGDGRDDPILGAPGAIGGGTAKGRVYVLYGAANLAGTVDLTTAADIAVTGAADGDSAGASVAGLGDVNRDGYAELAIGSPGAGGARGEAYVAPGGGSAAGAARIEPSRGGDAPATEFGPVARAAVDFAAGTASLTTVTLTRGNSGITGLSSDGTNNDVAGVHWTVTTDRSAAGAQLVLRYLDSEVAGLTPSSLVLYQAPAPGGPWSPATLQTIDITRNEIHFSADLSGASAFTLKDDAAGGGTPGPHVTSLTPASGAADVAVGTTVRAVFDTPINPATLNGATLTLSAGGAPVAGKVTYDSGTHTATFVPASALAAGRVYTVTLGTGITAQDGTPLANDVAWSFTTAFAPIAITPAGTGGGGGGLGWWDLAVGLLALAVTRPGKSDTSRKSAR